MNEVPLVIGVKQSAATSAVADLMMLAPDTDLQPPSRADDPSMRSARTVRSRRS